MTISGKYELLRPVSAAGFRSFHSKHVLTGQEVMVHFLQPGQRYEPPPAASDGEQSQILDAGTYEGTSYVVTYPVDDFTAFTQWLESVAPARRSAVTPSTPPPPAVRPIEQTAEQKAAIAASFQDVSPRSMAPPPAAVQRPDTGGFTAQFNPTAAAPAASRAPQPKPASSGEFTQMFGGQGTPPSQPPPVRGPAPAAPVASPASDSGAGFTQMFGRPSGAPPMNAPSAAPDTGGFAQVFLPADRGPLPAAPVELARPANAPPAPAASSAGEFTQMFSGLAEAKPLQPAATPRPANPPPQPSAWPAPPPPPRQAAPPPPQAGSSAFEGATQVFHGPGPTARPAPSPMPASASGPGEFTMVMRGSGADGGGPAAGAVPRPQASPVGQALPGLGGLAPSVSAPGVSMPSVTGPSVSSSGVTPPSVQGPYMQAPQMPAPRLDMQMPSSSAAPSSPLSTAAPGASGSLISPLLAAVLSCLATAALLAIVYVLVKR